jgi:hypothetical protein
MARGKSTTKRRPKVEANGKPEPTSTALPPVNFGFRFMRLKDWCRYVAKGSGSITKLDVEQDYPPDSEDFQWIIRVFRSGEYEPAKGRAFILPPTLGLVHVPFTHDEGVESGWWVGERTQADELFSRLVKIRSEYQDETRWMLASNIWHHVSDFEFTQQAETILSELLEAGKISQGDLPVVDFSGEVR